ncbi:MAG: M23 family metallopeptidase [Gammaproteobacteria bacterium]|nr:M23 family metallopeptidase [Gammaproteobacteria bacterium]
MRARVKVKVTAALAFAAALLAAPVAALELQGEAVQGGLLTARTVPGAAVTVDGRAVRVSDDGVFLLGFHRDEAGPARIVVTRPDGTVQRRSVAVRPRVYQEQRVDGLPPAKVTPDAAALARIKKENAQVARARRLDAPRTDFLDGFIWPARGVITGVYGSRRILNGEPRRPHFGVDIAAPAGAAVRAPAAGVVTLAHPDMFFSGGTLILDHGHGLSSAFLHLRRITVREGQAVKQGEIIAEIGATGRVTGAHLDWRINLFNKRLDPALVAGEMPGE